MIRWWVLGLFNAGCLIWLSVQSLITAGVLQGAPRSYLVFGSHAESMAIMFIWLIGNLVLLTIIFFMRRR